MNLTLKKANSGRNKWRLLLVAILLLGLFTGCSGEEASEASQEKQELKLAEMDLSGDWQGNLTMTSHKIATSISQEEMESCEEEFGVAISEVIVKQFDNLIDQPLPLKLKFEKAQNGYSGSGSLTIPAKLIIAMDPEGAEEDAVNEFQTFAAQIENNELHFTIGAEETDMIFTGKAVREDTIEGTFLWNQNETTFAEGTWQIVQQ